jgi:hypothetical protein
LISAAALLYSLELVENQHKFHCILGCQMRWQVLHCFSINTCCNNGNCRYLYDYEIKLSFDLAPDVQNIITLGAVTSLVAATAHWFKLIKKVLAYSTVSIRIDVLSFRTWRIEVGFPRNYTRFLASLFLGSDLLFMLCTENKTCAKWVVKK